MEYTLNMVFLTTTGNKVTFSITDIKSTLTETEANTLMDNMIAKNIFTTSSGDLISKSAATIVEKKVTKLTVD